jgi:hypothetical protein
MQVEFLEERLAAEGPIAMGQYGLWQGEQDEDKVPQEPFRMLHRGTYEELWQ